MGEFGSEWCVRGGTMAVSTFGCWDVSPQGSSAVCHGYTSFVTPSCAKSPVHTTREHWCTHDGTADAQECGTRTYAAW